MEIQVLFNHIKEAFFFLHGFCFLLQIAQRTTDPVYLVLPVDWSAIVGAHFLFLCIVTDPCASTASKSAKAKHLKQKTR